MSTELARTLSSRFSSAKKIELITQIDNPAPMIDGESIKHIQRALPDTGG
jgi:hypothetical protein